MALGTVVEVGAVEAGVGTEVVGPAVAGIFAKKAASAICSHTGLGRLVVHHEAPPKKSLEGPLDPLVGRLNHHMGLVGLVSEGKRHMRVRDLQWFLCGLAATP